VVEYRTSNREVAGSTHTFSTASNLEQLANLLCAQANSASYPQPDGKWAVATATGWRSSVADWGDVCLLAVPWVQLSVSAGNWWPHNALRHRWLMPISCHFRDCKALLVTSLTHVSGAIESVQTFTFTFNRLRIYMSVGKSTCSSWQYLGIYLPHVQLSSTIRKHVVVRMHSAWQSKNPNSWSTPNLNNCHFLIRLLYKDCY